MIRPPESLGDGIIMVLAIALIATWIIGWILLLVMTALQYIFPKSKDKIENIMQSIFKPVGSILQISFWGIIFFLALAFFVMIAHSLGWY